MLKGAGYSVFSYKTAGDFLMALTAETSGCLILDIKRPGPSGLELQETLAKKGPILPAVFLTAHGDIPTTVRAMKAGAIDFLTKPVKREILLAAVRAALEQGRERRATQLELLRFRACFDSLTAREKAVFERVVSGKPNKEIAAELGSAERTVKVHRAHLMEKMQAGSLADLVQISALMQFHAGRFRAPAR